MNNKKLQEGDKIYFIYNNDRVVEGQLLSIDVVSQKHYVKSGIEVFAIESFDLYTEYTQALEQLSNRQRNMIISKDAVIRLLTKEVDTVKKT